MILVHAVSILVRGIRESVCGTSAVHRVMFSTTSTAFSDGDPRAVTAAIMQCRISQYEKSLMAYKCD